ncbi:MAG: hypothetical protein DWQ04_06745 [Chloroflexi bacterium]|nr:MAG: hypothetical protein DWQ04_06745 [Chloroflexota bacterium]
MKKSRLSIVIAVIGSCLFFLTNLVAITVQAKEGQQSSLSQADNRIQPVNDAGMGSLPVIPETTKVLSKETTQHLTSISTDGNVYTFSETTVELESISVGDVIVSEKATLAPYGFLRKVTSITLNNEQIILETVQATLEEAIESAHISIHQSLTPNNIQQTSQLAGISLSQSQGELFSYMLTDVVLYDADGNAETSSDQIRANGFIELEIEYEFDLDIDSYTLESLTFLVGITETAELVIQSENVTLPNVNVEIPIGQHTFAPIPVGIPGIVVIPQLIISVGVDGSIQANISAGVTQQLTVQGGLTYDDLGWHSISNFSNSFSTIPPQITSKKFEVQGNIETTLTLLINGVAGPLFNVKPYLLFSLPDT